MIGEFSKLVRVSPRMLRHYEKSGLFYPAEIDEQTGYRKYSASQIAQIAAIVMLRDLGFSVKEIAETLEKAQDKSYMNQILQYKADEARANIDIEQDRLIKLLAMKEKLYKELNTMKYNVELKNIPEMKVLTLRGIIPEYRSEGILWGKLGSYLGQNCIGTSGSYSTFHDEEYMDSNPDVEIAVGVNELGSDDGDFRYQIYPEIPLAATLRFDGQYDGGFDSASAKIAKWMEENNYRFAGKMRSNMIVGPATEQNPEKWLTELIIPVVKED